MTDKYYYASTRDKALSPIQAYDIFIKDGNVYDRYMSKGRLSRWRRCYLIPANIRQMATGEVRGAWPLKIKYRGFELDRVTDCIIVNKSGPK